jgi:hypothetical protein
MDETAVGGLQVALFGGKARSGQLRTGNAADMEHLANFVKSRAGVQAYLEPRTTVTETTIVLVAATGEWTRRRVQGVDAARRFARKNGVPLHDVGVVGYPQRMRDWTAHRKATGQTGVPTSQDGQSATG